MRVYIYAIRLARAKSPSPESMLDIEQYRRLRRTGQSLVLESKGAV